MDVFPPWFLFPVRFFRRVWYVVVTCRIIVWDLDMCGCCGFQVKCLSGYWDQTHRHGYRLEQWWCFPREGKGGYSNRILTQYTGNGDRDWGEDIAEGLLKTRGWNWGFDLEEEKEKWRYAVSLLASLDGVASDFPGSASWTWELRKAELGIKFRKKRSVRSARDRFRREGEAVAGVVLQSWASDWGLGFGGADREIMIYSYLST